MKVWVYLLCFLCSLQITAQYKEVLTLKIEGNKKVKTSFIKRMTKVKSGIILDSVLIQEDIKRLKRLPSVAHAYFEVIMLGASQYEVIYHIEDNFTIIPSLSIYKTNHNELAYKIDVHEFNFLRQNIVVGGFFEKNIFSSFGMDFKAPYLFSRNLGIAINFQDLKTLEPLFYYGEMAEYRYNTKFIEVLGLWEINFHNRMELGLSFIKDSYEFVSGDMSSEFPSSYYVNKLLYKAIYEFNNLDYNYQYLSGFKSTLNLQYVTSEDQYVSKFFAGWSEFFFYKLVGNRGNWATRLSLGLSTNDDSPLAPFAIDDNSNLRGVGSTVGRGTGALIINTEFRRTLYEKNWFVLQGNVFVDAGTWRNPGGTFRDFYSTENVRVYSGLGLRFIHKYWYNAIFRIDYGFGLTPNASQGFVFGVGQYF